MHVAIVMVDEIIKLLKEYFKQLQMLLLKAGQNMVRGFQDINKSFKSEYKN